jgi:hypothetical protein
MVGTLEIGITKVEKGKNCSEWILSAKSCDLEVRNEC